MHSALHRSNSPSRSRRRNWAGEGNGFPGSAGSPFGRTADGGASFIGSHSEKQRRTILRGFFDTMNYATHRIVRQCRPFMPAARTEF